MADLSNVTFDPQNPNALFSPDQWSNQFSNFNNKPIPWPSSYAGYPTDAMGNPIAPPAGSGIPTQAQVQAGQAAPAVAGSSTPGTTLNSNPMQGPGMSGLSPAQISGLGPTGGAINELLMNYQKTPAAQAAAANPNTPLINYIRSQNQIIPGLASSRNQGGFGVGTTGLSGDALAQIRGNLGQIQQLQGQGGQAAPQQAAPAAPGGLTYPQVLTLLANPGKVTTPGATVPVSASAQPGGGVNNAFLRQVGGGAGMNKNFLNTLAALQGRG